MTLPAAQLRPLVSLRWRMVRSRRARAGLAAALLLLPVLAVGAVVAGLVAPSGSEGEVAILTPSILLAFFGLAVLAPLAAGGGTELYPADHLVAYPVRPRTVFRGALLLAPLNLAWLFQVLAALGLTTYVIDGTAAQVAGGAVMMLVYIAAVTVIGQGVAWTVVGLRQTRAGRVACWVVLGAIAGAVLLLIRFGALAAALDRAPTRWVFLGALAPSAAEWDVWAVRVGVLVAITAVGVAGSERVCRWALGRPGDAATAPESSVRVRRDLPADPRRALVALTRRGVWRSRSLRRGALLLALMPGAVIAAADVGWDSLLLLPGLVAAGAGMLFGVNAFCLDGSGATWIGTLPQSPSTTYWARTQVVAEVAGATVLVAVVAGALRAPSPTATQLVCFVAAVLVGVARVTATCMRLSVQHPHRAQLIGPRDAPAPPGAMAVYSVRLATSAALVGLLFTVLSLLGSPLLAGSVATALLLLAVRSLLQTARAWDTPEIRSRVVATVGAG